MSRKFFIQDEDERTYEVEELEEAPVDNKSNTESEIKTNDESLSEDEIVALKKLASVADKLVAMCETSDETPEPDEDKEDDEIDEDEKDDEKVLDTDEDIEEMKPRDSKKSFGSIERKRKANDSIDTDQMSIAEAWTKRYGGNR